MNSIELWIFFLMIFTISYLNDVSLEFQIVDQQEQAPQISSPI